MRILHEETPFSEEEKKQKVEEIHRNIKESITTILHAMPGLQDPPVTCSTPEVEEKRRWLLE